MFDPGENGLASTGKRKLPEAFEEDSTSPKGQRLAASFPTIITHRSDASNSTVTGKGIVENDVTQGDAFQTGTHQGDVSQSRVSQRPTTVKKHIGKFRSFFDLPAEIRIKIYDLALVKRGEQVWPGQDEAPRTSIIRRFDRIYRAEKEQRLVISPALLAVNARIRDEASSFLYSQPLHFSQFITFEEFLSVIGTNITHIKHIVLQKWTTNGFPISLLNKLFRFDRGSGLRLRSFTFRVHRPVDRGTSLAPDEWSINCHNTCNNLLKHSDITKGFNVHFATEIIEDKDDFVKVYKETRSLGSRNGS